MVFCANTHSVDKNNYNKWRYSNEKHGSKFNVDLSINPALMFEPNNQKVIDLISISVGEFPIFITKYFKRRNHDLQS